MALRTSDIHSDFLRVVRHTSSVLYPSPLSFVYRPSPPPFPQFSLLTASSHLQGAAVLAPKLIQVAEDLNTGEFFVAQHSNNKTNLELLNVSLELNHT